MSDFTNPETGAGVFELPREVVSSVTSSIKSGHVQEYALLMHEGHPNLYEFISQYGEGLTEALPGEPTGQNYFAGAAMSYALLCRLATAEGVRELPEDVKEAADVASLSEDWRLNKLAQLEMIKRLDSGQGLLPETDATAYHFRTAQLRDDQPVFFDAGVIMISRKLIMPRVQVQRLASLDTVDEMIKELMPVTGSNIVIDTRPGDAIKSFLGGVGEVVLTLAAVEEQQKAEAILRDDL